MNDSNLQLVRRDSQKWRRYWEDLPKLFELLEEGKIKPVITEKFHLLEARHANELLESGQVIGNIVLISPELL
jgi:NADPH:quinone reductase-like Zn-dependent oxidoreductase